MRSAVLKTLLRYHYVAYYKHGYIYGVKMNTGFELCSIISPTIVYSVISRLVGESPEERI